jgi:hypothetical protein
MEKDSQNFFASVSQPLQPLEPFIYRVSQKVCEKPVIYPKTTSFSGRGKRFKKKD